MLSSKTIELVKATAPILQSRGTEITRHFYHKMFSAHPELLNLFNHANQRQGRQQAALANAVYAAAANIDQLETIIPVVKQIAHKHRSLGVKPEQYPIVGENLLAAMKDVLGEAATPEILNAWAEAYGVIADVFISVEQDMYTAAAQQRGGWRDFRNFTIVRKVRESDVITSFYLAPADGGEVAPYLPGQYISVRVQIPGEEYVHIRQYSLSDRSGKEYYRISVKREDGIENRDRGIISNYLHASTKPGDVIQISAPAGDFTLDTTSDRPVVLLSGGVGVTPLVSMLHSIVEAQPQRQVTFIHAAIDGNHHALRDEVDQLVAAAPAAKRFVAYESPTSEDIKSRSFAHQGYLTADWLKQVIDNTNAEFYLCGPLPFMKAVYRALKTLDVAPSQIHYELFGPAVNLDSEEEMEITTKAA